MAREPIDAWLSARSPELEEVDLVPKIHDALAKGRPPSVLQVVILKDGLLIGTEVFVAGGYTVGAGPECDLRLDDASVAPLHARLTFARDSVGLEADGGELYVNGHPVRAAELRPVDEVAVGAFSLKIRGLKQKAVAPAVRPPPLTPAPPVTPVRLRAVAGMERTVPMAPTPLEQSRTEEVPVAPTPPPARGRQRLLLELYWGDRRQHARAFDERLAKKPLLGGLDDQAAMPLWGFDLPQSSMVLADKRGDGYRVFVPRGAAIERRDSGGNFQPLTAEQLGRLGAPRSLALHTGDAVRFSSGECALVASVGPALARPRSNPLAGLPHLALGLVALFLALFAAFVSFAPVEDGADFAVKEIPRAAVFLVRKEAAKKPEPAKSADKSAAAAPVKHPGRDRPRPQPLPRKFDSVLASGGALLKVLEQGIPMPPMAGAKKGGHGVKSILGGAPVAASGFPGLGLTDSTQGLGSLHGDGIGHMGAGHTGKGAVGGRLDHVISHDVALTGRIDRDAVAKVIESHLGEVSSCYERTLITEKDASGGKLTLEWNISTTGAVTFAKSKSSSMKSGAVEACILRALKGWKFPPAVGAGVTVTYPFLFHSVGY